VFFAAPWPLAHKLHVALHGLCAQQPSHSYRLGGEFLPFDSRMTGIYCGFLASFAYLALRGRCRSARFPSYPLAGLLALFVVALAIDGTNSFLRDMGMWHPYLPHNAFRLTTGIATGVTLAVVMCYLLAISIWREPRVGERPIEWSDLGWLLILNVPLALLAVSGLGVFYPIMGTLLLVSATAVVSILALVSLVILRRVDYSFDSVIDLQGYAATALLLGIGGMAALSAGRFLLEWWLKIPSPV
jgi:uncharacterized membrane protein